MSSQLNSRSVLTGPEGFQRVRFIIQAAVEEETVVFRFICTQILLWMVLILPDVWLKTKLRLLSLSIISLNNVTCVPHNEHEQRKLWAHPSNNVFFGRITSI
ncbi:hypothetical protein EV361DRAFT_1029978 [Lentinula raphanica]|uniref:Uncharacterized protein n=1 Tax=Lentinula raphanica TaxID=153919 RepID=A0AA38NZD0_9AGAR|nr:hypothetical protein F5878DRAFT_646037 [Lentinula raphanica]KAJ3977059.1 hypothetical protein EV361DRAFT_1029978 [Lentinula raphanica]